MGRMAALALTFLCGLGVGALVFRGADEGRRSSPPEGGLAVRPARPSLPAVPPAVKAPPQRQAPVAVASRATPRGEGVITGRIRTRLREPLEGVAVSARFVTDGERRGAPVEARSSPDGSYRLEGLADGGYSVTAARSGYLLAAVHREAASVARPGAIIDFEANALYPVLVEVVEPNGSRAPAARIEWTVTRRGVRRNLDLAWTNKRRLLELPAGRQELRAFLPQDPDVSSPSTWVQVGPQSATTPVTFALERGLSIRGRVLVDPHEEPETVDVFLLAWSGTEPPTRKRMLGGAIIRRARRSRGYDYAFEDLDRGTYLLSATRDPGRMEVEERLQLDEQPLEIDLSLPTLDPADYVVLWVRDPEGGLLADVRVSEGCRSQNSSSSGGAAAFPLEDGSFAVLPDFARHACIFPSARHFMNVRSESHGSREVEYDPSSDEPVVVQFGELTWLSVLPEPRSGELGLFSMFLRSRNPDSPAHGQARCQPDGSFQFEPVPPGRYEIIVILATEVFSRGGSSGGNEIARHEVDLEVGEQELSFPLPQLVDITVLVKDAGEESRIDLRQRTPGVRGWSGIQINDRPVDADGRVVFEAVPVGSYTLLSGGGYRGEMKIEVSEDAIVRFVPSTSSSRW